MGNEISKLFVVIGAKTADFEKGLAKTKDQMKQLGAVVTGIGIAITGTIAAITISWARAGDEVAKLADKTGFATETLSELRYAAQLSDSSLASLETGIKRMQSTIIDARDGLSTAVVSLKDLGLAYKDLKDLSPEEQFTLITNALADIPDPTLKAAVAVDIFGRAGTDMLPMLAEGSAGLTKMREEAHKLGLVFSAESAQKAEDFNDSITRLKGAISGLSANIAQILAPIITNMVNKISDVIQKITDWAQRHPELIRVITILGSTIGILCAVIGPLLLLIPALTRLLPLLGAAFHAALGPVGLITLAISGLIAVGTLLITNWGRIVAFFHGPAALATYELKQKIENLSDAMITGVKSATSQMISNLQYEASVERSILEQRQAFWKDKQYEKMDILDDVMLAEIKAIDPVLGARIEGINEEIEGIDAAGEARQRQADEDRAAAIESQLLKGHLSKAEKADLERQLADIKDYWLRKDLIDQRNQALSSANLDTYYADKQTQLDTATATEIQSYNDARDAFINAKDEQLTYLKSTWLPQYQEIMKSAGMEVPKDVTDLIESLTRKPLEYTAESPVTLTATPSMTFGNIPLKDAGGLIQGPGMFAVGPGVKEIARTPLMQAGGELHLHVGTLIADEMGLIQFGRRLDQILKANGRRTSFGQVQSGYFPGTSSK